MQFVGVSHYPHQFPPVPQFKLIHVSARLLYTGELCFVGQQPFGGGSGPHGKAWLTPPTQEVGGSTPPHPPPQHLQLRRQRCPSTRPMDWQRLGGWGLGLTQKFQVSHQLMPLLFIPSLFWLHGPLKFCWGVSPFFVYFSCLHTEHCDVHTSAHMHTHWVKVPEPWEGSEETRCQLWFRWVKN